MVILEYTEHLRKELSKFSNREFSNGNIIDESTLVSDSDRKKALMRFANVLRKSIKDDGTNSVIVTDNAVILEVM